MPYVEQVTFVSYFEMMGSGCLGPSIHSSNLYGNSQTSKGYINGNACFLYDLKGNMHTHAGHCAKVEQRGNKAMFRIESRFSFQNKRIHNLLIGSWKTVT